PPLIAAMTPSVVNSTVIPATNADDSAAPWARLCTLRAPNTLTVIAIIGYTQGVSEVATPAAADISIADHKLLPSRAAWKAEARPPGASAWAAEAQRADPTNRARGWITGDVRERFTRRL